MSRNLQNSERGPADFIMFGSTFVGFIIALGGVIVASMGVAIIGLMAMGLAFVYFAIQHWLSD